VLRAVRQRQDRQQAAVASLRAAALSLRARPPRQGPGRGRCWCSRRATASLHLGRTPTAMTLAKVGRPQLCVELHTSSWLLLCRAAADRRSPASWVVSESQTAYFEEDMHLQHRGNTPVAMVFSLQVDEHLSVGRVLCACGVWTAQPRCTQAPTGRTHRSVQTVAGAV
jgi:hypothetical protein